MSYVRNMMRVWRALNNPGPDVRYLVTDNGTAEILWALTFDDRGGALLRRKKFLVKDHGRFAPLWPLSVRAASADEALELSMSLTEDARQMSSQAFQGGFQARFGRLSSGTSAALKEVRAEAELNELLAYLLSSMTAVGMVNPPTRVGKWGMKIKYLTPKDAKYYLTRSW